MTKTTCVKTYDALLLDLDGTVYAGGRAIDHVVDSLNAASIPALYVTNNAARPAEDICSQLAGFGLSVSPKDVFTSADMGVLLLKDMIEPNATVLVIGTDNLERCVAAAGYVPTRTANDHPAAVIHGHNTETGWHELSEAALAIADGATYIATNRDATIPQERGQMIGNGSMIMAVVNATGVDPVSAGKPEPTMFHAAASSVGATRPLAVGDRLDTDIAGGNAAGYDTLQVLTGVNGPASLVVADKRLRPTLVGADMRALFEDPGDLQPGSRRGVETTIDGDGDITVCVSDDDVTFMDVVYAVVGCAWTSEVSATGHVKAGNSRAVPYVEQWW